LNAYINNQLDANVLLGWAYIYVGVQVSFFSDGTAKALPLFLLDDEKKNKVVA
jgi:hypothetical protein